MRALLVGYGRMGQRVAACLNQDSETSLVGIITGKNIDSLDDFVEPVDVIMDFSSPAALPKIASYVRRTHTPLISGTTGFGDDGYDELAELAGYAPILYSANYSLGVAVMTKAIKEIAMAVSGFDAEILESHHNQKSDAPSGTARIFAEAVDPNHNLDWVYGRQGFCGKRSKKELGIHSVRGGSIAGEHTIYFFGEDEVLELTHRAITPEIFAKGAVAASKKLINLPNGYYTLEKILFSNEE